MLRAAAAAAAAQPQLQVCVVCVQSSANLAPPLHSSSRCHPSVCSSTIQFKLRAQFAQCESCESVGVEDSACVCECVSLCVNSYNRQLMLSLPLALPPLYFFCRACLEHFTHSLCSKHFGDSCTSLGTSFSLLQALSLPVALSLSFSVYTRNLSEVQRNLTRHHKVLLCFFKCELKQM